MVLQPEPVAQRDQLGIAVTGAHEGEGDVAAPELVDDLAGGPDRQIDPVLRAHHPDIGHQVPTAAPHLGGLRTSRHAPRVGAGSDHRHQLGCLAPSPTGDRGVRLVGRRDPVGGTERHPLQELQAHVRGSPLVMEARAVELRAQVVVVEHEARAVSPTQHPGDRPEDVGRVARLHDVERSATAPGPQHQACGRGERVGVLGHEPGCRAARRVRPVGVDLDVVEHSVGHRVLPGGTDHRDVPPGVAQRLALEPHPTIERNRQVLDDDEHSRLSPLADPRRPCAADVGGHQPSPS